MSTRPAQPSIHRTLRRLPIAVALASCVAAVASCGRTSASGPSSQQAAHAQSALTAASCPTAQTGCGGVETPLRPPIGPAPPRAASVATPCAAAAPDPDNPMLTPLTPADIRLYLEMMRAAADRVRHPTAADRAALQHQQHTEAAMNAALPQVEVAAEATQASNEAAMKKIMAAVNKGDYAGAQATADAANATNAKSPPPALPEYGADADLAFSLSSGHADDVIVAERHVDAKRYARIVDVIEYIVIPPQQDFIADGDGPVQGTPCPPTARDRAIDAAEARQRQLLAPYRDQIRALETVVRATVQNP